MVYDLWVITYNATVPFNFPFDGTFLEFCIIVLVFGEVLSLWFMTKKTNCSHELSSLKEFG